MFALLVPDRPGGLAEILEKLRPEGVNVEYMHAFCLARGDHAVVVFRVADEQLDHTASVLERGAVTILRADEVYSL